MVLKSEHLPCEAEEILAFGEKKVKLIIASSHSIPKMGDFSLFQDAFSESREEDASEPAIPLNDQDHLIFETEPMEEMLVSEYAETAEDTEDISFSLPAEGREEQLYRLLEQLLDEKREQQDEEPDRFVFRCDGVMSARGDEITVRYEEDETGGMGNTKSEIVLRGGRQDMVSIVRTGSVANTLVCEKGRRHISAYNTPIMPFQICVFTKECEHNVSFESGGTIFMNYYVELRGTEMQHTKMRITVKVED